MIEIVITFISLSSAFFLGIFFENYRWNKVLGKYRKEQREKGKGLID